MQYIFFDTSVVLDYILHGKKYEISRRHMSSLDSGDQQGILDSVALLEIKYHLIRHIGHDKAEEAVLFLKNRKNFSVVPVTEDIAERAANLRIKYFNRDKSPISTADAIHIATALEHQCKKIITADSDFKVVSEIETEVY